MSADQAHLGEGQASLEPAAERSLFRRRCTEVCYLIACYFILNAVIRLLVAYSNGPLKVGFETVYQSDGQSAHRFTRWGNCIRLVWAYVGALAALLIIALGHIISRRRFSLRYLLIAALVLG